jgi:hypothetical protein
VDIIKWIEPSIHNKSPNKFLVVFSDGMIAFYHKDKDVPQNATYDPEKDMIKISNDINVSRA